MTIYSCTDKVSECSPGTLPMSYLLNNYHKPCRGNTEARTNQDDPEIKRAIRVMLGQDMLLGNPGFIKANPNKSTTHSQLLFNFD